MKTIELKDKYIFHVHSYRCGHAENVKDEEYVLAAIEKGAEQIIFTDHAPFIGDPYGYRMPYAMLEDYLSVTTSLKEKYKDKIEINIGMEIEYLPSKKGYYEELLERKEVEFLLIGQHFYEVDGKASFFDGFSDEEIARDEASHCVMHMLEAMDSGLFPIIAHPDRCFRRQKIWTAECENLAQMMVDKAKETGIYLEKNLASMVRKNQYKKEFWQRDLNGVNLIVGSDAHAVKEMHVIDKGNEKEVDYRTLI